MDWCFAHLGWWYDAINASCSHMNSQALKSEWTSLAGLSPDKFLPQYGQYYESALGHLSGGALWVVEAASLLFRHKALRKWRLVSNSQSRERRDAALFGWRLRNREAASAGSIPYPYDVWMRQILSEALPDPTKTGWEWTGRFGPGQVFERWSHPQRFERLVDWINRSPTWPEVPPHGDDFQRVVARLTAVPKDALKDRVITVESAYNSFAQAYVREALQVSIHHGLWRGRCMDLYATDGQRIQQSLALKASKDSSLATLDLKDASDRITWDQVRQVFPSWVVHLLEVTRTEEVEVMSPVDKVAGTTHKERINMFAGMGNGTTFTVETLFFASFVVAYAIAHGLPRFVSVFGDDIVCHSDTARALMQESFEFFCINHSKSFVGTDALREACGVFAYKGFDITCPKVDGYVPGWHGRMALADLHRRLRALTAAKPYGAHLARLIAEQGALPNWGIELDSYPCIDDPDVQRTTAGLRRRINHHTQSVEALLPAYKQKVNHYATWASDASHWNHPSPEVWYQAWLCGMLGKRDYELNSPKARRRLSIDWPVKDQFKMERPSWRPLQGPSAYHPLLQWSGGSRS